MLLQRFPDYGATLAACNGQTAGSFTENEQERHGTDHSLIGSLMGRSWGIAPTVCQAIRLHHDYCSFTDSTVPEPVSRLIAMSLIAELAIQKFARLHGSTEWDKGAEGAMGALMLDEQDVDEWVEQLLEGFALGAA